MIKFFSKIQRNVSPTRQQHVASLLVLCAAFPLICCGKRNEETNIAIDQLVFLTRILEKIDNKLDRLGEKMLHFNVDMSEFYHSKANLKLIKNDIDAAKVCEAYELKYSKELKTIAAHLLFMISHQGNNNLHTNYIEFIHTHNRS